MAGIYLHIPFCRQACHYCDFHFSTNLSLKANLVEAINGELVMQKNYLHEPVTTIYFGGGTPSLLSTSELHQLLETIHQNFDVKSGGEVTLEANPEDLTREKLESLRNIGINR